MSQKALIVIDVQVDFCPGGARAVQGGDEIVALINDLMTQSQTGTRQATVPLPAAMNTKPRWN